MIIVNWDAVGAVGEIVGAVAVLVTLAFLTIQLRQNTRSSQNASWQAIIRQLGDLDVLEATDPGLSPFFEAAVESPDSITDAQYRTFAKIAQPRFGALEYAYLANKSGTIDSFFWEALEPYTRFLISKPGYQRFWRDHARNVYHPDFIAFVEAMNPNGLR
jgi:hypothetical protein